MPRSRETSRQSRQTAGSSDDEQEAEGSAWSPLTLRRKGAAISDLLSGRAHSSRPFTAGTPSASAFEGDQAPERPRPPRANASLLSLSGLSRAFTRDRDATERASLLGEDGNNKKRGYDGEFREELEKESGTGVRLWYDNFHTIDWVHDNIKESIRLRRLRARRYTDGWRGWWANFWDGCQGWLLVTAIGILTAGVAWLIISSEMLLFDLKTGYCATNPRLPHRFCCAPPPTVPTVPSSLAALFASAPTALNGAASPHAYVGSWKSTRAWLAEADERGEERCENWRTWGDVWTGVRSGEGVKGDIQAVDYVGYIAVALVFATLASILTIYLSSSTSVFSSKDNASVPYPSFSPAFPQTSGKKYAQKSKYGATSLHVPHPNAPKRGRDRRRTVEIESDDDLRRSETEDEHEEEGPLGAVASSSAENSPQGVRTIRAEKREDEDSPTPGRKKLQLYFAAGSGIPEVKSILSGFVIRGYLGGFTLFTKSVGLVLAVASGLSLGKEGPFVQIASCVGNIMSRFFPKYDRNEAKRREIISAACAAGVAVAFGAPVGGTLFSLEEVSTYFAPKVMWRSFFCAAVAAMTLKLLDPFRTGKIVLFAVGYDRDWHTFELIGFVLLGVAGGLYGAAFTGANVWWTKNVRKRWLKTHPILEVGAVTLATVLISFFNPFTKMGGTELVYELFSECHKKDSFDGLCVNTPEQVWPLIKQIGFALIAKALLTTVTFGIKLPGEPSGIFIPTLAVGGCLGRIAGLAVEYFHAKHPTFPLFEACRVADGQGPLPFGQSCVLPGVWAMIGASAALAGVTRTTVSLAVIVFELTGTLGFVVPVMLSILVAKAVADAFESRSIYDLVIEVSGLPYLDSKAEYIHESTPADIMDGAAPVINLEDDNTVGSLREQLADLYDTGGLGFPLITTEDGGRRMYGYIASKELEFGLSSASHLPEGTPVTFRSAMSLRAGFPPPTHVATPAGTDLSWLSDQAPISVSYRTATAALHELFSKLGLRYVVIVDEKGRYLGIIDRLRYLGYLAWLKEKGGASRWGKARNPSDVEGRE